MNRVEESKMSLRMNQMSVRPSFQADQRVQLLTDKFINTTEVEGCSWLEVMLIIGVIVAKVG